jgi:hypothetical protein
MVIDNRQAYDIAVQMAKSMRLWEAEGGMSSEADIGPDEVIPDSPADPVRGSEAQPNQSQGQ